MAKPKVISGNIFESKTQVLINPINCVGVMGAGLAKQFKNNYPEMFSAYTRDCRAGLVVTGEVRFYPAGHASDQVIANLPTKRHWKNPSKMEYVEDGLLDLRRQMKERGYRSVAVPALGAGLGGLEWGDVLGVIEDILDVPYLAAQIWLQTKRH